MQTDRRLLPIGFVLASVALVAAAAPEAKDSAADLAPATGLDGAAANAPTLALSRVCRSCHSNADGAVAMRDTDGAEIGPHNLWRGSVHSAAAVDPIWRATLAAEMATFPEHAADTVETCTRCHAPLANVLGFQDHGSDDLLYALDCDEDLGLAARDGVSCTSCHGVLPDGLGEPETFDGRYRLDEQRRLFGPHADPVTGPMRVRTGFTPTESAHVLQSGLCATCHTLTTESLDAEGQPTGGHFLEQGPFLEWSASAFATEGREVHCQACHLPKDGADGDPLRTRLARNPGGRDFPFTEDREPFGRHEFHGGNVLLLDLVSEHAEALRAPGAPEDYAAALDRTREQLESRTASLEVSGQGTEDGSRWIDLTVYNRTGHKLPTGYPARRLYLTVEALDAAGAVLFASGRTDGEGRLVNGAGQPLPTELLGGPAARHLTELRSEDEAFEWRSEAVDSDGAPTFRLLRMADWGVDDRLLPAGWSSDRPGGERTAPVGTAGDPDFLPGRDGVRVWLPADVSERATELRATLHYQPYSPRWLAELLATETDASRTLNDLLGERGMPSVPLVSCAVALTD